MGRIVCDIEIDGGAQRFVQFAELMESYLWSLPDAVRNCWLDLLRDASEPEDDAG